MHRNVQFAFFAALFFSVFVAPAFADNRVALVIGNSAYMKAKLKVTCFVKYSLQTRRFLSDAYH